MSAHRIAALLLASLLGGAIACSTDVLSEAGDESENLDGGTCDEPLSVEPHFSITFQIPEGNPEYRGDCTFVDASAVEDELTLELDCAGASVQITVPGAAAPPGLEIGETLSMVHIQPSETDFSNETSVVLSDDEGLVLAGFRGVYDRFSAGAVEFDFLTECAAVHDYSDGAVEVEQAAGFVRITGAEELDLAVDESGMIAAAGQDYEAYVHAATAYNCCHGDIIGATIVRR